MADASVALLADHVWPALIPGSTGTGRSPAREPKLSPHTLPVAACHQPLERQRVRKGHGPAFTPFGLLGEWAKRDPVLQHIEAHRPPRIGRGVIRVWISRWGVQDTQSPTMR